MNAVENTPLRKGFTTGTCAQAAAKAAVIMLIRRKPLKEIKVETPSKIKLNLAVIEPIIGANFARCAVVKDSGDDPDITNGIKIYAEVRFSKKPGVSIKGGRGIGKVTKPGLAVEAGYYAINPVPKQMIIKEVLPYLSYCPKLDKYRKRLRGFEVILSAQDGERLSKLTFNPRLGIIGGISILGTTGIVEPKSLAAYKASLSLQLDVLKASGYKKAALVLGYVGERFCKETLGLKDEIIIKIGDHVGFMVEECRRKEIRKVLLVGHISKLLKVAAGQFNTHYQYGDNRIETLVSYAKMCGASLDTIKRISSQEASEAAVEILKSNSLSVVFDKIAEVVVEKINSLVKNSLQLSCIILSLKGEVLASIPNYERIDF